MRADVIERVLSARDNYVRAKGVEPRALHLGSTAHRRLLGDLAALRVFDQENEGIDMFHGMEVIEEDDAALDAVWVSA